MDNPVKENLKYLMTANEKISEGELSRRTGIPQTTIHRILSGQIKESKPSTLKPIAQYFGWTIAELQGETNPPPHSALQVHLNHQKGLPPAGALPPPHSAYQVYLNTKSIEDSLKREQQQKQNYNNTVGIPSGLVPLITWEQASTWKKISQKNQNVKGYIATNKQVGPYAFGLVIQGNSMTATHGPSFEDGYEIVVDPDRKPKHQDFVIVKQDNNSSPILRQLSIEGGSLDLLPLNPRYSVTKLNSMNNICGVVCQLLANF